MKRIFYILLAVLFALPACQDPVLDEIIPEPEPQPEIEVSTMHTINVTAGFSGETKTTLEPTSDGGYSFKWTARDKIKVWQIDESGGMETTDATVESDTDIATFPVSFSPIRTAQRLKYLAIYPHYYVTSQTFQDYNGVTRFRIQMPTWQNLTEGSFDPQSDLLVSQVVDTTIQPSDLTLNFARVGSILKMNISGLDPAKKISWIELQADSHIAGYVQLDPQTGEYHLDDTFTEEEIESLEVPLSSPSITLRASVDTDFMPDGQGNTTVFFRSFPASVSEFTLKVAQCEVNVPRPRDEVAFRRVNIAAHPGAAPIRLVDGKMTEISVNVSQNTPIESVAIVNRDILAVTRLTVGKKYQLKAALTPLEASVETFWGSSNRDIATVDDYGMLTAKAAGDVTITCSAGQFTDEVTVHIDEYIPQAVDLGLPSGTLWSSCNLGANTPTGYGLYYTWGDPVASTTSIKSNYIFWRYSSYLQEYLAGLMTKYTFDGAYAPGGVPDNKQFLDPVDDPATVHLGSEWRSPTDAEITELFDNCSKTVEEYDGVNVIRFTSRANGNSIVIPLSGDAYLNNIRNKGELIRLWTCENIPSWEWQSYQMVPFSGATTEMTQENKLSWPNGLRSGYESTENIWASSYTINAQDNPVSLSHNYVERFYHNYCIRPVKMSAPQATTPNLHIVSVENISVNSVRVTMEFAQEEQNTTGSSDKHYYLIGMARAGDRNSSERELTDITKSGKMIIGTLDGLYAYTEYSIFGHYERRDTRGNVIMNLISDNRVRFTSQNNPAYVLTDFEITPASVTLDVGESVQIVGTITPSTAIATVTYQSSDTRVATVSETGLITAVGKGTALVEACAQGIGAEKRQDVFVVVSGLTYGENGRAGADVDDTNVRQGGSY